MQEMNVLPQLEMESASGKKSGGTPIPAEFTIIEGSLHFRVDLNFPRCMKYE